MDILFINQSYYPDMTASSQYLADLTESLSQSGHKVTVLAGRRNYLNPQQVYAKREVHNGVDIIRVHAPKFSKSSRLRRMMSAALHNLGFLVQLLFMKRQDVIVAMTSPPLIAFVAMIYAKLKHVPFVYWIMDINPDQAISIGWLKENSLMARTANRMFKTTLKNADRVIVLDEFMKARLLEKKCTTREIHAVPLWSNINVDTIDFDYLSKIRQEHNLQDKFVLMYAGNLSISHSVETILKAAQALQMDERIVFCFAGGGARKMEVEVFQAKHHLKNIMMLPYVPKEKLKDLLLAADAHFVVMGESQVGIVHPSKIYSILALGKPFIYIGPENSFIGTLVKGHAVGVHVNQGQVNTLVEKIHILKNQSLEERRGYFRKQCALAREFDRKKLTKELENIIMSTQKDARG